MERKDRDELVRLVRVLAVNSWDYCKPMSNGIFADVLSTEKDAEETLFTLNQFRVTFGVVFGDDTMIITSYRLYKNDEQIIKTDNYFFREEIMTWPEDFECGHVSPPDNQFDRFIGEIIYYYIKDVKIGMCYDRTGGLGLGNILISGLEKVGDRIAKRLQDVHNVGKKITVSIAKGIKVEVSFELWDWDAMNDEGDVIMYFDLKIDGEEDLCSVGSCKAFLCYPYGEPMDPDTLRQYSNEGYLDMLGSLVSNYLSGRIIR